MKKKKIIQGFGVVMIAIGIGLTAFGLFGRAGLLDGYFSSQPVKVYDWTEEETEEKPEGVGMPVIEEKEDDVETEPSAETEEPENTMEGEAANEETK